MKRFFLIALMAITTTVATWTQDVYYVNVTATGGDGTSWETAFNSLQDALNVSSDDYEIWVAEGEYYPNTIAGNGNSTKDKAFVLKKNVRIYGGFNGSETNFHDRNWKTNITILSGDLNEDNIANDGDAYHVIISSGDVGNACLDGITISGAYNTTDITSSSAITVKSNTISKKHGGGIYIINSSPILKNLIIENNQVFNNGGGVYIGAIDGISIPTLTDVIIRNNSAQSGGGIYNESNSSLSAIFSSKSSPVLTNVTISENTANVGGGIYNNSANRHHITSSTTATTSIAKPALTNVRINNNTATGNGGGMYNYSFSHATDFSASNASDASPVITNVEICGNKSGNQGGGIFNNSNATVVNTGYTEASSSPVLTNVLINGNYSVGNGSGMYNTSSASGIYATSINNSVFTNVTISGNKNNAVNSSVIHHYVNGTGSHNYNPQFNNCIILGNNNGIKYTGAVPNQNLEYKYCIVQGLGYCENDGLWDGTYIADDIFEEPKDVNDAPTVDGNYQLKSGSFAINKGDNDLYESSTDITTDLDEIGRAHV